MGSPELGDIPLVERERLLCVHRLGPLPRYYLLPTSPTKVDDFFRIKLQFGREQVKAGIILRCEAVRREPSPATRTPSRCGG